MGITSAGLTPDQVQQLHDESGWIQSYAGLDLQQLQHLTLAIVHNTFYSEVNSAQLSAGWAIIQAPPKAFTVAGNVFAVDQQLQDVWALNASGAVTGSITHGDVGSLGSVVPVDSTHLMALVPSQPTRFADLITGDPADDATTPNAAGDFIDGYGFALNSSRLPLDSLFHAPGHERIVDAVTPAWSELVEAYHPLYELGNGALLSADVLDPQVLSVVGATVREPLFSSSLRSYS